MASDLENLGVGKLMPADFLKLGKERTDAMMTLQKDSLDAYEQASKLRKAPQFLPTLGAKP